MTKPSILFMGTPDFARVILQCLYENQYPIVGVFAQPDKPSGRGQKLQSPPVALFAKEKNLPLYQPSKLKNSEEEKILTTLKPDYIIVAAYGKILGSQVLSAAKKDILNVHASLLPKYRGAAPINYSLLEGETETGVSIMRVVPELDAGPVYLKKSIPIHNDDTAISLFSKLGELGSEALVEALTLIEDHKIQATEQNHQEASYASKLTKEMGQIDWTQSAQKIFNQIRGLQPWPAAKTTLDGKSLKILSAQPLLSSTKQTPGTIVHLSNNGWTVTTGDRDLLVTEVQVEGKAALAASIAANGLRLKAGSCLGNS